MHTVRLSDAIVIRFSVMQNPLSSPPPLQGRGWGWGLSPLAERRAKSIGPTPTPPLKGRGLEQELRPQRPTQFRHSSNNPISNRFQRRLVIAFVNVGCNVTSMPRLRMPSGTPWPAEVIEHAHADNIRLVRPAHHPHNLTRRPIQPDQECKIARYRLQCRRRIDRTRKPARPISAQAAARETARPPQPAPTGQTPSTSPDATSRTAPAPVLGPNRKVADCPG